MTEVINLPDARIARVSSQCPCCEKFISKNKSWCVRLPRPLPVRMRRGLNPWEDGWYSMDTGKSYNFGGAKPKQGLRWFVHEYCYERALDVLDGDVD